MLYFDASLHWGHRCFVDNGREDASILKPGEVVNVMTVEFSIFGPAINVTSLPRIAQHFVNVYRLILIPYGFKVLGKKVVDEASSQGM